MATNRKELRKAIQLLAELRQKYPHRTFWMKECYDGFWSSDYWIFTKPFQRPRWYQKLLPRLGVAIRKIR